MNLTTVAVAVYGTHDEAETAIKDLQKAGFDMKNLSIAGRDYHTDEHVVGYYNAGDRMKSWGKKGAFWGGIWGWLFGSAFFMVPGFGPLLLGGPIVGWFLAAMEGAIVVGGLGVFGGALASLGIPEDSVLEYETALKADKFVVIAHATQQGAEEARSILHFTSPESLAQHEVPTKTKELALEPTA